MEHALLNHRLPQPVDVLRLRWLVAQANARLSSRDVCLLRRLRPWVVSRARSTSTELAREQFRQPSFARAAAQVGLPVKMLAAGYRRYLLLLFRGRLDDRYLRSRLAIDLFFADHDLELAWDVLTQHRLEQMVVGQLARQFWYRPLLAFRVRAVLGKLLSLDHSLVLHARSHRLEAENDVLRQTICSTCQPIPQPAVEDAGPRTQLGWPARLRPEPGGGLQARDLWNGLVDT